MFYNHRADYNRTAPWFVAYDPRSFFYDNIFSTDSLESVELILNFKILRLFFCDM